MTKNRAGDCDDAPRLKQAFADLVKDDGSARKALSALYQELRNPLMASLARRQDLSVADREEALQNTFLKLAAYAAKLRSDGGTEKLESIEYPKAYLFQILDRCRLDLHRRTRSDEDPIDNPLPDPAPPIEEAIGKRHCLRRAWAEFRGANPDCAAMLDLVVQGLPQKDIANAVNRSYGATREALSQCRKKLKQLMVERCGDYLSEAV